MINFRKALIFGALALGIGGLSAYASGAFSGVCTAQGATAVPAAMTAGGNRTSCSAASGSATAFHANVQNTVLNQSSSAVCPYTGKTATSGSGVCPFASKNAAMTTASATCPTGQSCGNEADCPLNGAAQNAAMTTASATCPAGASCDHPESCPETTTAKAATMAKTQSPNGKVLASAAN